MLLIFVGTLYRFVLFFYCVVFGIKGRDLVQNVGLVYLFHTVNPGLLPAQKVVINGFVAIRLGNLLHLLRRLLLLKRVLRRCLFHYCSVLSLRELLCLLICQILALIL